MQPCDNLFGSITCASYGGSLTLTTVRTADAPPYTGPQFQAHLDLIGIGEITAIGSLEILIIQASPLPVDIALSFLPQLSFVAVSTVILECNAETLSGSGEPYGTCADPMPPATPRLTAVPALQGVQRLGFSLDVFGTAFVNMQSFGSLKCPPAELNIYVNPLLMTLAGLETISPWTEDTNGPFVAIVSNQGLTTPASVTPLSQYLRCGEGGSDLTGLGNLDIVLPSCTEVVCPPLGYWLHACQANWVAPFAYVEVKITYGFLIYVDVHFIYMCRSGGQLPRLCPTAMPVSQSSTSLPIGSPFHHIHIFLSPCSIRTLQQCVGY
jgi:hypothetical protein